MKTEIGSSKATPLLRRPDVRTEIWKQTETGEWTAKGRYLIMCFSELDNTITLLAVCYSRDGGPLEPILMEELGRWDRSLRSWCVGLLLAKEMEGNQGHRGGEQLLDAADQSPSWIVSLSYVLSARNPPFWVGAIFGDHWKTLNPFVVKGGRTQKGRNDTSSGKLRKPASAYYLPKRLGLDRLRAFIVTPDCVRECGVSTETNNFLQAARLIHDQVEAWHGHTLPNKVSQDAMKEVIRHSLAGAVVTKEPPKTVPSRPEAPDWSDSKSWVAEATKDLLPIPDFARRAPAELFVASVAAIHKMESDLGLLLNDYETHAFAERTWNVDTASLQLMLAKWYASQLNELAAGRVMRTVSHLPCEVLEKIGVWARPPDGICANLLPAIARGHLIGGDVGAASQVLAELRRFAEARAMHGPWSGKWDASRAFVDIALRTGQLGWATDHFEWMVKGGFRPEGTYDSTLDVRDAFMQEKRWEKAFRFTERCEVFFPEAKDRARLWLNHLRSADGELEHGKAIGLAERVSTYAKQEEDLTERAGLLARLARVCAGHGLKEVFESAIRASRTLLEDNLKPRGSEGGDWSQAAKAELAIRADLGRAYIENGNKELAEAEVERVLFLARRLVAKDEVSFLGGGWLGDAAELLSTGGRFKEALELALQMRPPVVGSGVLLDMIRGARFDEIHVAYQQGVSPSDKPLFIVDLLGSFQVAGLLPWWL
jgi:tetratricopeptide (TPR) repeat protein